MKTKKTEGHGLVPAVRGDGAVAAPDFAEVLVEGGGLADGHAAERIRRHLAAADILGRISLAHAVAAGWELACQKAQIGWGGWERWCRQELGFSKDTAERYIGLFRKTVGAAREAIGIADESPLTRDEVEKATAAVDATTATGAMVELGIVRRNPDHGGDRRKEAAANGKKVGRPTKNPDLSEDARKSWTLALESFRKMPDTSYRFVPLGVAEGVIAELNAVCDKLAARIAELKKAEE